MAPCGTNKGQVLPWVIKYIASAYNAIPYMRTLPEQQNLWRFSIICQHEWETQGQCKDVVTKSDGHYHTPFWLNDNTIHLISGHQPPPVIPDSWVVKKRKKEAKVHFNRFPARQNWVGCGYLTKSLLSFFLHITEMVSVQRVLMKVSLCLSLFVCGLSQGYACLYHYLPDYPTLLTDTFFVLSLFGNNWHIIST